MEHIFIDNKPDIVPNFTAEPGQTKIFDNSTDCQKEEILKGTREIKNSETNLSVSRKTSNNINSYQPKRKRFKKTIFEKFEIM